MDGEAPEVTGDPASAQPLGDGGGGAGAAEAVKHQVALVAAGLDDALKESLGLLSSVCNTFICL
jgi:hypothetical protein